MNRGNSMNSGGGSNEPTLIYGRVTDIVMDANHPKWQEVDQSNGLYGVFFREIGFNKAEDLDDDPDFARCGMNSNVLLPVKGEIVQIQSKPSPDRSSTAAATDDYWTGIVNVWNHPNHNASPITDDNDFGLDFKESEKVNPIQGFPGDVLIEGRHGNTLRFGGTNYDTNIFSEESNNGKPYTILRVGQDPDNETPMFETIVEDINLDKASLYLTSDHILELEQANVKASAYKSGEEPELSNVYRGSQGVLNADRLFFNAKEESAFISSKISIGLSSEVVAIDADKYIGLDAKRIYLGTNAFDESEPALKGNTTKKWLENLVKILDTTAQVLGKAPPAGTPYAVVAVATFNTLIGSLKAHTLLLNTIESKKVYIDKL
tara:strand:+ start:2021 stop:3148 length:1128 start_codon:yes stop_codon:yes gene_type:complete